MKSDTGKITTASLQYTGLFIPADREQETVARYLSERFNEIAGILAMNEALIQQGSLLPERRAVDISLPEGNLARMESQLSGLDYHLYRTPLRQAMINP